MLLPPCRDLRLPSCFARCRTRSGFLLPFALYAGVRRGGAWTFLPLVLLLGVVPVVDWLGGLNLASPEEDDAELSRNPWFRAVTWAWVPVQFVMILWAATVVASHTLTPVELIGLTMSTGLIAGTIGITFAHELVHRPGKFELALGEILLASTSYAHFAIEHVYGHHRRVATPEDPATARYDESLYHFIPRCVFGSIASAWRFEAERLAKRRRAASHPSNRLLRYAATQVVFYGALLMVLGVNAALFVAAQAIVAFSLLETIRLHRALRARARRARARPLRAHRAVAFLELQPPHQQLAAHQSRETLRPPPRREQALPTALACGRGAPTPGRIWLHVHRRARATAMAPPHEPPRARLARAPLVGSALTLRPAMGCGHRAAAGMQGRGADVGTRGKFDPPALHSRSGEGLGSTSDSPDRLGTVLARTPLANQRPRRRERLRVEFGTDAARYSYRPRGPARLLPRVELPRRCQRHSASGRAGMRAHQRPLSAVSRDSCKSGSEALPSDAAPFRHCPSEHPVIQMIGHWLSDNPSRVRSVRRSPEARFGTARRGAVGPHACPPAGGAPAGMRGEGTPLDGRASRAITLRGCCRRGASSQSAWCSPLRSLRCNPSFR